MSSFEVLVVKVQIEEHPEADRLELAVVGDYRSVVGKGQFTSGELVAYIPEASIIPLWLQKELGVENKLAGPKKNRVKAIRLRGILSQGLVYPARDYWKLGEEVSKELKIKKWEPPIPTTLAGEVFSAGSEYCIKYDIENYKRFPKEIQEGEQVVYTEKIHGTWCQLGILPARMATMQSDCLSVTSKGLGSRGLAFKKNEANANNLYMRVAKHLDIFIRVRSAFPEESATQPIFILGEVFGHGVQDMTYNASVQENDQIGFRIFDIYLGTPGYGNFLNDSELDDACDRLDISRVPVLFRGPFSHASMKKYTDGPETVSGRTKHIREGIVIKPRIERRCQNLPDNRVQLKSISEKYLLRKNGTEYT